MVEALRNTGMKGAVYPSQKIAELMAANARLRDRERAICDALGGVAEGAALTDIISRIERLRRTATPDQTTQLLKDFDPVRHRHAPLLDEAPIGRETGAASTADETWEIDKLVSAVIDAYTLASNEAEKREAVKAAIIRSGWIQDASYG